MLTFLRVSRAYVHKMSYMVYGMVSEKRIGLADGKEETTY